MSCDADKKARVEAVLGELTELSLMVARELAARLRASEDVAETVALGDAFNKVTRAARLTLALGAKLERDAARDAAAEARETLEVRTAADAEAARAAERRRAEEARAARAAEPADPIEARKDRVVGLVKRLLWNESEGDTEDYEVLVEDLDARLAEAARHPDFLDIPIEALARRVIADMGLAAHPFALSLAEPKPPPTPAREPQTADSG
jgi:hypothetical protein